MSGVLPARCPRDLPAAGGGADCPAGAWALPVGLWPAHGGANALRGVGRADGLGELHRRIARAAPYAARPQGGTGTGEALTPTAGAGDAQYAVTGDKLLLESLEQWPVNR